MKRPNHPRRKRDRMTLAHDEDIVSLKAELAAVRDRQAKALADAEYMLAAMMRAGRVLEEIGGREILNLFRSATKGRD